MQKNKKGKKMNEWTFNGIYWAFCLIIGLMAGAYFPAIVLLIIAIPVLTGLTILRIVLEKYLIKKGIIR